LNSHKEKWIEILLEISSNDKNIEEGNVKRHNLGVYCNNLIEMKKRQKKREKNENNSNFGSNNWE
jgi:hypothetical protein